MRLKDKLQVEIMDLPIMDEVIDDIGTNLEYVTDNFAIGFAEWCVAKAMGTNNFKLYEGELEMYKKEKGL